MFLFTGKCGNLLNVALFPGKAADLATLVWNVINDERQTLTQSILSSL